MAINLNDYEYSYANAIGSSLKQPLFKLVSKIAIAANGKPGEPQACRIAKVAFHCLKAAVFLIPAGLAWFVGKTVSHFSKTQIDHEGLHVAPESIQIPEDLASDQTIKISVLSDKFNALSLPEESSPDLTSKQESLQRLCDWIVLEHRDLYPDDPSTRKLFCKQVSIFLKGIIHKIDSGKISEDKKREILKELAEASRRCYPTWLEVSAKLFGEVRGQVENVPQKLLRFIQDYKESITLEFCQNDADLHWHGLNYLRNILGSELGLNTTLNALDFYAGNNDKIFSKNFSKWIFLQRYEDVNRLIASIQITINSREYDPSYHDFLVETVGQQKIENPTDYVADHFYTEDFKLNDAGVNLMLRSIGILK